MSFGCIVDDDMVTLVLFLLDIEETLRQRSATYYDPMMTIRRQDPRYV